MVDATRVDFVEDLDGAGTTGAITDTSGLFTSVEGLDIVSPHQVEYCIFLVNGNGVTKTALVHILIELEVLTVLPVHPVILLEEMAMGKVHDACDVLADVTGRDNVVASCAKNTRGIWVHIIEEVNTRVQLVVCVH